MDVENKVTKEQLIKIISKQINKTVSETREFYNSLEDTIFSLLSSVNEDQNVCIKLFEGITLDGTYISEKTKQNNLTGKISLIESKIKPKFSITRSYCEKLQRQSTKNTSV